MLGSRRSRGWAAAAAAIGVLGGCGGESGDGPLQGAELSSLGVPATQGQTLTFSLPVVYNVGDDTVTLERVELERPDAGVELRGALTAGNDRQANYQDTDVAFPPRSKVYGEPRPLKGTEVPPVGTRAGEAGVELLIGIKVTRSGRLGARGLVVHYRDGDERRKVRVPNALTLCASKTGEPAPRECEEGPLPPRGDTETGRS